MMGRRILVVDDDQGMVETLSDILELHGWEPIKAYDGQQAITVCREEPVDVVLMDIRMPRINGADALRAIKATNPSMPVILITAIAAQELMAQAERDGALKILRKPLDLRLLLAVLDGAAAG